MGYFQLTAVLAEKVIDKEKEFCEHGHEFFTVIVLISTKNHINSG